MRSKCKVQIQTPDGATMRQGDDLPSLLASALLHQVADPLVFLAVVVADIASRSRQDGGEEAGEMAEFVNAAATYAEVVTARWDKESEQEQACERCSMDDRDRLIEEELRAAKDAGAIKGSKS